MNRYKLTISYDGTCYSGWQVQPKHVTVQQLLQDALKTITGERVVVHGSGRTDQGVHARGQVAHLDLHKPLPCEKLQKSLNGVLPQDIRILKAQRATASFDARRGAVSKEYRYFIWNADVVPPFLRLYRTHIRTPLDVDAMARAAKHLVGRHDFAAFTANSRRVMESTTRNLTELKVKRQGKEIVIVTRSNGFLYKMVRSFAGFLIKVGKGDVKPAEAGNVLASRQRTTRVPTAKPEGLFLWSVRYPRA